ncbi:hypothetical protein [Nostoc sp.]|uniref:hypothetical protein n=1 Tax=Nostoc sp. TaxID=1180 RepID=UPI002FF4CFD5
MTVNQATVHSSTVSIPAPLYKIGQQVEWKDGEYSIVHEFTGIVTGQTCRIDCEGSKWSFAIAITKATRDGRLLDSHIGGHFADVAENRLCVSIEH